ncbi:hypothetical protein PGB90_009808 [Kerria lacca]
MSEYSNNGSKTSMVTFNLTNDFPSIRKHKSICLLKELTSSWSSEPVCVKYNLKDEGDTIDTGSSLRDDMSINQNFDAGVDENTIPHVTNAKISNWKISDSDKNKMNQSISVLNENWTKKRTQLLRQCTEYLELESVGSKYTRDNFRKGFLNKVRI